MKIEQIIRRSGELTKPFRITDGKRFRLDGIDPGDTLEFRSEDKPRAKEALGMGIEALAELQDMLYAQDRWAVLLVFQAMDAAGKDSTIKHVMSGVNPQGCQVYSFKAPSDEELDHDYLWRSMKSPARARAHRHLQPQLLRRDAGGPHPSECWRGRSSRRSSIDKDIWKERYEDIRNFERYLTRNGVVVRKFFLHVSKKEQKKRFLERLENPEKNWKFSAATSRSGSYWNDYMEAYEDAIRNTATKDAPWYVVPADNKWFTRVVVAAAIVDTLGSLGLGYPEIDKSRRKELVAAKGALLRNRE